jgi:hypothetical protein
LIYVLPVKNGFAPIGLTEKLNAPATILSSRTNGQMAVVQLYQGGVFQAYSAKKPAAVRVDGKNVPFIFRNHLLEVEVPQGKMPILKIQWSQK